MRSAVPGPGTATVLFPGTVPGLPVYTVKVDAKFPAQQPAIRGVLCLHDAQTGDLMVVMDSTYLTDTRPDRADAFVREMSGDLAVAMEAASSPAEAVREAGIVLVATRSTTPSFSLRCSRARRT